MDVDGWLINAVKSMYKNAKTSVKVNGVGGRIFRSRWEFIKGPCSVHYSLS